MLTKQEMFDRAWKGLKAQGWAKAYDVERGVCTYLTEDGKRCAWGHVDPDGTKEQVGTVADLNLNRVGLAAYLYPEDVAPNGFACQLQRCHDRPALNEAEGRRGRAIYLGPTGSVIHESNTSIERAFRALAEAWGLTIPDDCVGHEGVDIGGEG